MPNLLRSRPVDVIDGAGPTIDYALRRQGWESQAEQRATGQQRSRHLDDAALRQRDQPPRVLSFFREQVGGTGTQVLRRHLPNTTGGVISTSVAYPLGEAGVFWGAALWSLAARSAGSATLELRLAQPGEAEVVLSLPDVVLDAVTTQAVERCWPPAVGLPFANGATLRVQLALAGWTPNPTDFAAEVFVSYAGLV